MRAPGLRGVRNIDAPWCPEMMVIPAGQFVMGPPPDEKESSAAEGPPGELPLRLAIQAPTLIRTDVLGFRLARTLQ